MVANGRSLDGISPWHITQRHGTVLKTFLDFGLSSKYLRLFCRLACTPNVFSSRAFRPCFYCCIVSGGAI